MKNRFYIANNIDTQNLCDCEYHYLVAGKEWLQADLENGQKGEIFTCEYLDDDGYEYKVLYTREYKKVRGKLVFIRGY